MFGSVIPYISSTYSVSILYAVCFRSKHVTSSPCLECRCTSILRMFLSVPVMPWCQDAVMPWTVNSAICIDICRSVPFVSSFDRMFYSLPCRHQRAPPCTWYHLVRVSVSVWQFGYGSGLIWYQRGYVTNIYFRHVNATAHWNSDTDMNIQ